jgi:REP element-mobilizing transposase RayT
MLLYVSNSTESIHLSDFGSPGQGPALPKVLMQTRGNQLAELGAYCLMSNHVHLLVREKAERGITTFMQKLGTAYTMYFNIKYERTGALFSSRFKAKHVAHDAYFRRVVNYVHANPVELFEPTWKEGVIKNPKQLKNRLLAYRFSSLPDYENTVERIERAIIAKEPVLELLEKAPSFETLLEDARIFYGQREGFEEEALRPGLAMARPGLDD